MQSGSKLSRYFQVGAALAGFAMLACTSSAAQQFQVTNHWKVPGDARWDYLKVDPEAHLLYLTHGTSVEAIDVNTGKIVGPVTGLKGVHGVALDPAGQEGYISDGADNTVVVFDRHSFAVKQKIAAGTNPDGIAYDPATATVWAFNGRSKNVTVIDTKTKAVVATVALPGKPEFPAADGKGAVFANIEDMNEIVRIDAATHAITATWPLKGCESPSGLAMDTAARRLFSVCDGKVMAVTNADTGASVATVAIGDGPDAVAYDANRKLVFSSNGEGTLTVVKQKSADVYEVLQTVVTQKSARTLALDAATGAIFLAAGEFGPRPAATADNPHPRPQSIPGSFVVLVVTAK
jgi:YVTN family beta-propeller protein